MSIATTKIKNRRTAAANPRGVTIDVAIMIDDQWQEVAHLPESGSAASNQGEYIVKTRASDAVGLTLSRADGRPMDARRIRATMATPLLNFAGVVVPDCGRHYILMSKGIDSRIAQHRIHSAMCGNAFVALADEFGQFLMAFGVLTAPGEVEVKRILPRISNRKAMVGSDELLSLEFSWAAPKQPTKELEIGLYLNESHPTWIHALREYANLIRKREGIAYPQNPAAWDPTWCTWTAFCSNEMTADRVLENAKYVKELGMGTIILDDGWFGPGLDDDPADIADVLNLGDYYPDPQKFPDLKGLIAKIQKMGLKALLWHSPLSVARTSKTYEPMKQYMIHRNGKEFTSVNGLAQLCPACPAVREHIKRETTRFLTDYGADGLKVDLYNNLPDAMCDSPHHEHDTQDSVQAVNLCMETQWQHAASLKPDVIFELKQDYGNVRLARHGTMVRAGDTAYDVDTNLRRCFYIQALGHVVHNDYVVTSIHTDARAMTMLMIRMLTAGVPTFGLDLARIDQSLRDVIARWLGFYNAHREMFKQPREPQRNDLCAWQGGSKKEAWAAALWQCNEIRIPEAEKIYVMNGTGNDELYLRADKTREVKIIVHDYRGEKIIEKALKLEDGMRLPLPGGSLAEIA